MTLHFNTYQKTTSGKLSLLNVQVIVVECARPERPEGPEFIKRGLTTPIWELIEHCWAEDRQKRPKFDDISRALEPFVGHRENQKCDKFFIII